MQKLSAINYIKNNKHRVAVLIVSLGLCFIAVYLTKFLLSTTEETFSTICLKNTKKIQYIGITESSLGLNSHEYSEEDLEAAVKEKNLEIAEKLKSEKGVEQVYYAQIIYNMIVPAIGNMTVEIPCVDKEEVPIILNHFNAKLIRGRLPQNSGEIVLDKKSMQNGGFELNGYFREDDYQKNYVIVGVVDCDLYFGCGIKSEIQNQNNMLTVLSDGSIKDINAVIHKYGVEQTELTVDYKWGKQFVKSDIKDIIDNSTKVIYMAIMIILSLSIFIVYTMYLRDRHNEWCLYCSIGYQRKEIYFSILRELLFTFGMAFVLGGIVVFILVNLLDYVMIEPLGIKCRYFLPETIAEIFCSYVLILGMLHIPVRFALYKIRTIDAIDDDLY
ncbi:MAG: hypothetical protein HDT39_04140 [Lachnospiraceae bacterium]|nr:hypothetical protein [Lachnospiraceae bacterium]